MDAATTALFILQSSQQATINVKLQMRGIVFLLIALAEGMLPGGAHLGLNNVSHLHTTAFLDEDVPKHYDAAEDEHKHDQGDEERVNESLLQSVRRVTEKSTSFVRPPATKIASTEEFEALLAGGCLSEKQSSDGDIATTKFLLTSFGEENTIRFFHWLRDREGMQHRADRLQQKLLGSGSDTAHETLQRLWLEERISPEDVLKKVDSWQGGRSLWLEYTNRFRKQYGDDKFSIEFTLDHLNEAYATDATWLYGAYFQVMKDDRYLKSLGQTMEKLRFDELIREKITPLQLSRLMTLSEKEMTNMCGRRPKIKKEMLAAWDPGYEVINLPKDDPMFRALEAYTLQYVATRDEHEFTRAQEVFKGGDRDTLRGFMEMLEKQAHVDRLTPSRHYGGEYHSWARRIVNFLQRLVGVRTSS